MKKIKYSFLEYATDQRAHKTCKKLILFIKKHKKNMRHFRYRPIFTGLFLLFFKLFISNHLRKFGYAILNYPVIKVLTKRRGYNMVLLIRQFYK